MKWVVVIEEGYFTGKCQTASSVSSDYNLVLYMIISLEEDEKLCYYIIYQTNQMPDNPSIWNPMVCVPDILYTLEIRTSF